MQAAAGTIPEETSGTWRCVRIQDEMNDFGSDRLFKQDGRSRFPLDPPVTESAGCEDDNRKM